MRVALIDHYDSFTFNVLEWLAAGDAAFDVTYAAYDDAAAMAAVRAEQIPLIISPGPKRPDDAPQTLALLEASLGKVPILGICLGHQLLAHLAGARIVRSREPLHGSTRRIAVTRATPLLDGLGPTFDAAVYNSLTVDPATLPPAWSVDAVDELGEVQALSYAPQGRAPAFGVQFHPESYLSQRAARLVANWRQIASHGPSGDTWAPK